MKIRRYRNGVLISEENSPSNPPVTVPANTPQQPKAPVPAATPPAPKSPKKGCGCGKKKP